MTINDYVKELYPEGINFIDIGSSGALDVKWDPIKKLINLVGFDPNKEDCERQNRIPSQYKSSVFLPYAVHGKDGVETLYKTKSIYCYSLLHPNEEWLKRFSFHDLFEILGQESIEVKSIDRIRELDGFAPDVIKMDVQGLELPILKKSDHLLEHAFYVETESGFVDNYIGETTYSQIDELMRSKGFLLFDINVSHRIPRNNRFKEFPTGKEQLLWCEAVWLKDYIALERKKKLKLNNLSDKKIKKILVLCALQRCYDFGYELAEFFHKHNMLNKQDLDSLGEYNSWIIQPLSGLDSDEMGDQVQENRKQGLISFILEKLFRGSFKLPALG